MKECLQVFHLTTFDAPKYALKDAYLAYLAMFGIFDAPKYALKIHIWPCLAYLGAPNMVNWGVPENILQNAVQTRWA